MVSNRMAVVLERLSGTPQRGEALASAAAQAAAVLGVDGICAGLGTGPSGIVLAWGCGPVSAELEELQFTLGEGPGPDASAGAPVSAPDLAAAAARWPAFALPAAALGVRAVFAWPLRIGAINVGTLVAHRSTVGPMPDGALADAWALADTVTVLMLHQKYASVGLPVLGSHPSSSATQPSALYRAEVHQAAGVISLQLGVGLAEALVRLRAYAFAAEQPVCDVAAQVVARRLHFDDLDR